MDSISNLNVCNVSASGIHSELGNKLDTLTFSLDTFKLKLSQR